MGKKSKKSRATDVESGMGRHLRREVLEICNLILEKCKVQFKNEWDEFVELFKLIEKLQKKQQGFAMKHHKRQENVKEFMKWLTNNGVDCSGIEVEDFSEEGLGLKATRLIKESELILSIPRKVMITSADARKSPLGPMIKEDCILKVMPNIVLSLFVLCECHEVEKSVWAPYLKVLPSTYTTPLYASIEDLQKLKGSPSLSDVINQFRNVARQYAYFFKLFQGLSNSANLPIKLFCYDDYRWAVSTVMTRQNKIPKLDTADQGPEESSCGCCEVGHAEHNISTSNKSINENGGSNNEDSKNEDTSNGNGVEKDEEKDNSTINDKKPHKHTEQDIALIPFWDMCNHANGFISTDYNTDQHRSECYSMHEAQPGQQLKIFYGPRNNSEFFIHNGFVFEGNKNDCIPIKLGVSKNDPLFSMKAEVMARANLSISNTFYLSCYNMQPVEPDLIAFLRVFSMNIEELMPYLRGDGVEDRMAGLRKEWVHPCNEMKVWSFLHTRCQLLLRNYATTLEEDELTLKATQGLSRVGRNAVLLRVSEKKILNNVVKYCCQQKEVVMQFVEKSKVDDGGIAEIVEGIDGGISINGVSDSVEEECAEDVARRCLIFSSYTG